MLFDKFGRPGVPASDDGFYFAKSRPFDTCFVLIMRKQPDGIRGFYYETLPDYHNGLYDYMSRSEELLYFDGFSFKVDSLAWDKIVTGSEELLANPNHEREVDCLDCGEYVLAYDSKKTRSNFDAMKSFESYEKDLKKILLYDIFKKKISIEPRIKKEMKEAREGGDNESE